MTERQLRALCHKYWDNQCSPEEAQQVLDWLTTPAGQQYYEQCLPERIARADKTAQQSAKIYAVHPVPHVSMYPPLGKRRRSRTWAIAAAMVGVLLVSGLAWWGLGLSGRHQQVATTYGQTRTVALPDGSRVVLNANSSLSFAPEWPADQGRELWLEGEAYFSVVHTAHHTPFTVHSGEVDVEVLGTEFSVSNWDSNPEVVLTTGRVRLKSQSSPATVEMQPGEMVAYSRQKKQFGRHKVDAKERTAWKDQQLLFKRTPLREVFRRLEHTEGLRIDARGVALDSLLFTATLPAHQPQLVLQAAGRAFNLRIEQQGKLVIIHRK